MTQCHPNPGFTPFTAENDSEMLCSNKKLIVFTPELWGRFETTPLSLNYEIRKVENINSQECKSAIKWTCVNYYQWNYDDSPSLSPQTLSENIVVGLQDWREKSIGICSQSQPMSLAGVLDGTVPKKQPDFTRCLRCSMFTSGIGGCPGFLNHGIDSEWNGIITTNLEPSCCYVPLWGHWFPKVTVIPEKLTAEPIDVHEFQTYWSRRHYAWPRSRNCGNGAPKEPVRSSFRKEINLFKIRRLAKLQGNKRRNMPISLPILSASGSRDLIDEVILP